MMFSPRLLARGLAAALVTFAASGCSHEEAATKVTTPNGVLTRVGVQTDWAAQAEHGGFYQAVAKGFYAKAGLQVDIMPGGPGVYPVQGVATNRLAFAITRSDEVIKAVVEDVPLQIVCGYLQHDPQAILFHEGNPIASFKDLDGKVIMSTPGAYWISHAEATFGIRLNIQPMNYGLASFLSDKNFIQQCFVTNEPFFARRAGAKPQTLLLSESGYDPYRCIFTNRRFARENPEIVRAFIAATIAGWEDYIFGDPEPGNALIRANNPEMPQDLLDYSRNEMRRLYLVQGKPDSGDRVGLIRRRRLQEQLDTLLKLKVLPEALAMDKVARFDLLPAELQALAEK